MCNEIFSVIGFFTTVVGVVFYVGYQVYLGVELSATNKRLEYYVNWVKDLSSRVPQRKK